MNTVLILGGFGFIGTNLLKYIDDNLLNCIEVVVFDKKRNHPFGLQFKCVKQVYTGDFTNYEDLALIFEEHRINEVFHFLNTTVPATSSNIGFDVETNLLGTIGLLKLLEKHEVKKLIYLSSGGAIYNNINGSDNVETADTFPLSSYGVVKLAIEKYIYMFCHGTNTKFLILRLSNPYGFYHYSEKQGIINLSLRKGLRNEKVTVWGNGNNKKDYIFVTDFIEILMQLYQKEVVNEIINVGSGQLYSINDILNNIKKVIPTLEWDYIEEKKFDNTTVVLNTSKLAHFIGQYQFVDITSGLQKTINWLKEQNAKVII